MVGELSDMMAQRTVHRTGHVPTEYPEILVFVVPARHLHDRKVWICARGETLNRFGVYCLESLRSALS